MNERWILYKCIYHLCEQVRAGVGVDLIGQVVLDVLMFTLGNVLFDLKPIGTSGDTLAVIAASSNFTSTFAATIAGDTSSTVSTLPFVYIQSNATAAIAAVP